MKEIRLHEENIDAKRLESLLTSWLETLESQPKKVLLVPPDITRFYSKSGSITQILFNILEPGCHVDILPALGTHMPMTREEKVKMYGPAIPDDRFLIHDWRNGVVKIGEVPGEVVSGFSDGLLSYPVEVELDRILLDDSYDQMVSIGQVVPHEVAGMGGYNKNIFVGCGGSNMINKTHFLGAAYGMERIMGRPLTPVRKIFNYAEDHYITRLPLTYMLTVTTSLEDGNLLKGLFIGRSRKLFLDAAQMCLEYNMKFLERELNKVVVYLDPEEYKTTWLGDKAIYRTRMVIADGGELLIIAPGVKQFGEDQAIDRLIRKYGHVGSQKIIRLAEENADLKENLSAAAHLIHGSTEGRFSVTYATDLLSKAELDAVNISHMPLKEALARYPVDRLKDGMNVMPDGEEIFYVNNPALGLWALRKNFDQ